MKRFKQAMRWALGGTLLASAVALGVFGIATASNENLIGGYKTGQDYDDDHDSDDYESTDLAIPGSASADTVYMEECGACHMAYPPGLLPSSSWKAMMQGLDDHFGENAELPADITTHITGFLDRYASDRMNNTRFLRGVQDEAPLRITDLPYFKREHREIPRRMGTDNPQVGSFSRCDACHRDAEKGRFDEDTVAVPGFGRWDD